MSMNQMLALIVAAIAAGPEVEVEADRLLAHVRDMPASRTVWTTPDAQSVLLETEARLLRALRGMGYAPIEQPLAWTTGGTVRVKSNEGWTFAPDPHPKTWRNFYVEIPGRESPNDVVLIGAHFDLAPGTPGADDNASGTSAAMELARILKDRPMRRTVRIVFFNLEEIGLIGSTEHAAWTKKRIDAGVESIIGMVSLEMLGYYSDEPGSQRIPIPAIPGVFEPPTVGNFLGVVATQESGAFARELAAGMRASAPELDVRLIDFIPAGGAMFPDIRRSDHAPFWDIGVPATLVTDTSEFRTPHYHKASDTVETLEVKRFTLATKAIVGAVWRLAGPIEAGE